MPRYGERTEALTEQSAREVRTKTNFREREQNAKELRMPLNPRLHVILAEPKTHAGKALQTVF